MKKYLILAPLFLLFSSCSTVKTANQLAVESNIIFDQYFTGTTMRFDFHHAGDCKSEYYYFDRLLREGEWAGSRVSLINPFDFGEQQFCIIDAESKKVIYKNNYCTLFNEWQTTEEATRTARSMPESLIFPEPKRDFIIEIYARNKKSRLIEKRYSQIVYTDDYNIRTHHPNYECTDIHIGGSIANSLDIVLLSDGFTADEKEKFIASCKMWSNALFKYSPFNDNKSRINIRAVWAPSKESGISEPGKGKWVETILDCRFYTLGSERYQMTEEFQKVRDIAAAAPYESIFILTNTDKYGGGGIYNFYGLGSAGETGYTGEVYIHEFGHSLMGLGDEYVEKGNTVSAFYPTDKEPWEANLTTFVNFKEKWENMIDKATAIPTPFDEKMLKQPQEELTIGAYEGGGYLEKGIYRPTPQCMMNQLRDFCPVCQEAIKKYLDYICR